MILFQIMLSHVTVIEFSFSFIINSILMKIKLLKYKCFNESEVHFNIKCIIIFIMFQFMCTYSTLFCIKVPKETQTTTLNNLISTQIKIIVFLRKKSFLGIISCCVIYFLPISDQEMIAFLNFVSCLVDGIKKKSE